MTHKLFRRGTDAVKSIDALAKATRLLGRLGFNILSFYPQSVDLVKPPRGSYASWPVDDAILIAVINPAAVHTRSLITEPSRIQRPPAEPAVERMHVLTARLVVFMAAQGLNRHAAVSAGTPYATTLPAHVAALDAAMFSMS